jgi:hypothetical protein
MFQAMADYFRNRFYFATTSKRLIQKKDGELEIKETVKKGGRDRTELSGRLHNHSPEDKRDIVSETSLSFRISDD